MKRLSLYRMIFFLSFFIFIGCSKDGAQGPQGPQGIAGIDGHDGNDAIDGNTILNGSTAPSDQLGNIDDFYINTKTYKIYGPKSETGWGVGENILGEIGPRGPQGPAGKDGKDGDDGKDGKDGHDGAPGLQGAAGQDGKDGGIGSGEFPESSGENGSDSAYSIFSGIGAPSPSLGKRGDFYIDLEERILYYKDPTLLNDTPWRRVAMMSITLQFTIKHVDMTKKEKQQFDITFPWYLFEKSAVNIYAEHNDFWYQLPGTYYGETSYKVIFGEHDSNVRLFLALRANSGGTPSPSSQDIKIRVVITTADLFDVVSQKINFNHYREVKSYFELAG